MAFLAACGRWDRGRNINHGSANWHLVGRTAPILTLILLLAACSDPSAPLAREDVATYQPQNAVLSIRGWTRRVVRIRIAPDTAVVSPGQTATFTASGTFMDGRSKLVSVSWSATGGTIDSAGVFTADSTAGLYLVIGTEPLTGLTDTAAVVDQAPPVDLPPPVVAAVSVSPSPTSMQVGDSIRLVATAKDANGATMGGTAFTWASSDPNVATVSSKGMVKAVAGGSAMLTATTQGVSGDAAVSVTAPAPAPVVAAISVSPSSPSILVGDSIRLVATAKDANGASMGGTAFTWASSDPDVATVSSRGMVKAVAGGSAILTATAQGVSGEATVRVTALAPAPAPPPAPSPVGDCSDYNYTRLVPVSTASELSSAIRDARPGDMIELAAGTYTGYWSITTSGTSTLPILLCGPRTAILTAGTIAPTAITLAVRANYWTLQGFTIRTAFQPLYIQGAHDVTVKGLEIYNIGNQAITLNKFATRNLIDSNYIHDTGKTNPLYGEGIYIGSASNHWCENTGCNPDRTDYNTITRNIIGPNIGSEMIDVKDGTTGTVITRNHYNGSGTSSSVSGAWVMIAGNDVRDSANVGVNAPVGNGYYVEQVSLLDSRASTVGYPWGQNNRFVYDSLDGNGAAQYGFLIGGGSKATTTLKCSSVISGFSGGRSNMSPTCTQ